MSNKPPRLPLRFFRWFCHPKLKDSIEGDLMELYDERLKERGKRKADLKFIGDVLLLFRPSIIRPMEGYQNLNNYGMIKSYFTIAFRTIKKNKVYSFINVLGLALGLCACITIYLIVHHEFSFDTFHDDKDRIYRLVVAYDQEGEKFLYNCVPAPTPIAIRNEISGIDVVTGFHYYSPKISIADGNNPPKKFEAQDKQVILADPEYFNIFKYKWLAGNPARLHEPFSVVLSERKAHDYFSSLPLHQILGKEIMYDSLLVNVVGIVQDWTENSDFPMTDFISFSSIVNSHTLKNDIYLDNWGAFMNSSQAFIKLGKGQSPEALTTQLTTLLRKYDVSSDKKDGKSTIELKLQPLTNIHFNPDYVESPSLMSTLYVLIGLALFILILAAINFINLSTAQAVRRAKEIGIRKVLGSFRIGLVVQFLIETLTLTSSALGIALLSVNPILSLFSSFIPNGVKFNPFSTPTLAFLLGITFVTALLAGLYPAKVISSYLPTLTLKGNGIQKGGEKWFLRKGLIIFQFSISLFFITGTVVINNQLHYIRSKDKGFITKDIFTFRTKWGTPIDRTKILAEKIKQINGVNNIAIQSMPPMGFAGWISSLTFKGNEEVKTNVSIKPGDSNFIPFYDIQLLAGRNIFESDTLKELVINSSYLRTLGFMKPEEAIGQFLYFNDRPYPIVGVVENFHERSFHDPIGPCAIGNFRFPGHGIAVKLASPNNQSEILGQVEKLFKETYPDEPFYSRFIDDEIGSMHERDQKIGTLANVSMIITIFISCMGIFGLAMFTSEMKTKEIGIRKVLGASVKEIVVLLSKEFIVLIVLAILIASPVSWYVLNKWLLEFAYRVDITVWVYVISGLAALSLGLLTISFRTVASALTNPVNSLRSE